jgi:hypothetical protein
MLDARYVINFYVLNSMICGSFKNKIKNYASSFNFHLLISYSDADWCGVKQDRKSTSGYLFKFLNDPISWCAKKQPVVALLTCESEYIAECMAACQAVWLENILKEMEIEVSRPITLFIDNKSAISLARNPTLHGRSKHT